MKAAPFLSTAKAIVLVCFTLFVVLPLLVGLLWKIQDWRYTRFCWRSQEYYARVAEACDQLLASAEPLPRELKREKVPSWPPILRELNLDHIVVETNMVMMVVGGGLMSHQIIWEPAAVGSFWNLTTGSPETRKSRVIYTKAKPTSSNPASAGDGGDRLLRLIERSRPAATDSQR